jgi:hypothetical protein
MLYGPRDIIMAKSNSTTMYCFDLLVLTIASLRFLAIYITARTGSKNFTAGLKGLTDIFIEILVIFGMFPTITVCPPFIIS